MAAKKQSTQSHNIGFLRFFKTDCPRCMRIRYIIVWGILMGLIYFGFWAE
ncbi:hypothetical protein [Paraglaciecola sp. 20A4]|nr:hypothetical protein [Paraglaciecola sp. 20A4]